MPNKEQLTSKTMMPQEFPNAADIAQSRKSKRTPFILRATASPILRVTSAFGIGGGIAAVGTGFVYEHTQIAQADGLKSTPTITAHTPTVVPTFTETPVTPTNTPAPTETPVPTNTLVATPTEQIKSTPTITAHTPTVIPTETPLPTNTPSPTETTVPTNTPSPTETSTPVATNTPTTPTSTPESTPTFTPTATATQPAVPTLTATVAVPTPTPRVGVLPPSGQGRDSGYSLDGVYAVLAGVTVLAFGTGFLARHIAKPDVVAVGGENLVSRRHYPSRRKGFLGIFGGEKEPVKRLPVEGRELLTTFPLGGDNIAIYKGQTLIGPDGRKHEVLNYSDGFANPLRVRVGADIKLLDKSEIERLLKADRRARESASE